MERGEGAMLNPIVVAHSKNQFKEVLRDGAKEVIVAPRELSRFGRLSLTQSMELAKEIKAHGMRPLLQWDILMTETVFRQKVLQLRPLLEEKCFSALRVQDPGALGWALEETDLPLHWIAETGNHNLKGLDAWARLLGKRGGRLVLSFQLPRERLETYAKKLPIPLELLGLGPILLFYSPRSLLKNFDSIRASEGMVTASSEESAHKGFPVISNDHGSFLFHQKHLGLLEHARQLQKMGITHLRLEGPDPSFDTKALRWLKHPDPKGWEELRASYPKGLICGFYRRNKSDVLFPKLKNERLERARERALGEVIGVEKGAFLGIRLRPGGHLEVGGHYLIQTPEGKSIPFTLHTLKCADLSEVISLSEGTGLIGPIKGVGPGGLLLGATV
ncbi:MAG: U32 family peptidase [Bacteriovoracales bacterium]|nr:U32 family peptidase [Bacteriovoracales bacterium]